MNSHRQKLEPGQVYCHKCNGFGHGSSDLDRRGCLTCEGKGILRRERFGAKNPIAQHLDANDSVGRVNGMPFSSAAICASAKGSPLSGNPFGAVECRMAVSLDSSADGAPSEVMVMPGGVHKITASQDGKPVTVTVKVGPDAALAMQASLEAHRAAGPQRPWFDFDHAGGPASAWPLGFEWRDSPTPGVYARVEWSKAGAEGIQGKMYRAFSPVFHVSDTRDNPAHVTGAPLNMGALVNDPAFKRISPLWASNVGGPEGKETKPMTPEELAALQARLKQLETENADLKSQLDATKPASQEAPATAAADETQKEEIAQLKQTLDKVEGEIKTRRKADADGAVKAAVARGALPAKDEAIQAKWRGLIESDPSNSVLLAGLPSNPALRPITAASAHQGAGALQAGGVRITREDSQRVLLAYAQEPDARARGAIYARDISPRISAREDFPLQLSPETAIHAANSLGTLAGDLIAQRALELLIQTFPELASISTDFSAEPVKYGQTIRTRIISIPSVVTYNTTTGYASSDATDTDVPITINAHKAVQVAFNANDLSSTNRNLFEEQAQAMQYALGKDLVDALYALILIASYTNSTVKALASFSRIDVIAMGKALSDRGVPKAMRKLLLNSAYYAKLAEDTSVVSGLVNVGAGDAIRTGKLPDVHGFGLIEAVNLPTTGNLTGFGVFPSAWAMAVRLPDDYTKSLPGVTGGAVVRTITEPNTGLSMLQTQFVDHLLGRAYTRNAWQYGVAKGDANAGQLLTSV